MELFSRGASSGGLPFEEALRRQVEQVDIRLTASHAQASAASRDLQTVSTQVTTQYSMNGDIAPLTYQRMGNLGKVSATLVEPAIQECVKSVTAKFTAEELVTKREVVKLQIQQSLVAYINNTLREKGVENAISIANLAITDFNFSPEFNRAIESKVQADKQALQAKNESSSETKPRRRRRAAVIRRCRGLFDGGAVQGAGRCHPAGSRSAQAKP